MINICIWNIPIKDLFYLVGIIVTLYLGIKNISILNTNRKNSLQESVYKEQMNFMLKLSGELIKFHRSMTVLRNNKWTVKDDHKLELAEQIVLIHEVLLSNAVICSDNIMELSGITLAKADIFIDDKYEKNNETDEDKFNDYFVSFLNIISEFKKELGIRELNKENQSLFNNQQEIWNY